MTLEVDEDDVKLLKDLLEKEIALTRDRIEFSDKRRKLLETGEAERKAKRANIMLLLDSESENVAIITKAKELVVELAKEADDRELDLVCKNLTRNHEILRDLTNTLNKL